MTLGSLDQREHMQRTAQQIHLDFQGIFSVETIERLLADSLERLSSGAATTAFVDLLAERFTRERLQAVAKVERPETITKPTVLFLCVHNAGRSQMAAGWLQHLAGDRVDVLSGGSAAAQRVNPASVQAMSEVGIDIEKSYPKPWTEETLQSADVVVTMGCGDACPVIPGKRYVDWEIDDPSGRSAYEIRLIRDDIERPRSDADARTGYRIGTGGVRFALRQSMWRRSQLWAKLVVDHCANELGSFWRKPKPGPLPPLFSLDEPGVDQDRKVMADRRLAPGNGSG